VMFARSIWYQYSPYLKIIHFIIKKIDCISKRISSCLGRLKKATNLQESKTVTPQKDIGCRMTKNVNGV
jgi:hypothetical protein